MPDPYDTLNAWRAQASGTAAPPARGSMTDLLGKLTANPDARYEAQQGTSRFNMPWSPGPHTKALFEGGNVPSGDAWAAAQAQDFKDRANDFLPGFAIPMKEIPQEQFTDYRRAAVEAQLKIQDRAYPMFGGSAPGYTETQIMDAAHNQALQQLQQQQSPLADALYYLGPMV
jgi:hypothetical protein